MCALREFLDEYVGEATGTRDSDSHHGYFCTASPDHFGMSSGFEIDGYFYIEEYLSR